MKYVIDVPEEMITSSGELMFHYKNTKDLTYQMYTGINVIPYTEPDHKAIEDEVWKFSKVFYNMSDSDYDDCYGVEMPHTYQEAKAKYEAWKQKVVIHVGDEVGYEWHGEINKFIVIEIRDDIAYGFGLLGNRDDYDNVGDFCHIDELKKTGRHFSQVTDLLKEMKGECDEVCD